MTNRSNLMSALLDKVAYLATLNGAGKNKLKKVQFEWGKKYSLDCMVYSLRQIMSACTPVPTTMGVKGVIQLPLNLYFLVFNAIICLSKALKNKHALLILACLFHMFSLSAQTPRKDSGAEGLLAISGTVVSSVDGKPIQGVSIRVEGEKGRTSSKNDGSFSLPVSNPKGIVSFSHVGFKRLETSYTAGVSLAIKLIPLENQLEEVDVVSTGYQKIPKERATGSFEVIGKQQLNISKSTNIINRLEGLSPALRFEKRVEGLSPLQQLSVRTTSTYYGYYNPLVILDNFPYEGDIANINPNDIESVTILKDAAAASIWGTRAANGVIVLTSKRGTKDGKLKLSVQVASQLGEKPDIYKKPYMSSSSFMEMEELLFKNKFFDWQITSLDRSITPMVVLMDRLRKGEIDQIAYDRQKAEWSKEDVRKDYLKYIYRNSYNQQYATNITGGSANYDFQASVGYDKNRNNIQNGGLERVTARLVTNIRPVKQLEIGMQLMYGNSAIKGMGTDSQLAFGSLYSGAGRSFYPYLRLVDDNGKAVDLETVTIRKSYIDTLAGGRLMPAHYNIFNEIASSENKNSTEDVTLNLSANWKLTPFISANVAYQFQKSANKITNWQGIDSYFTQHYINMFTQWTPTTITRNVPIGDIFYQNNGIINSHYLRGNLAWDQSFDRDRHKINAIVGAEMKDLNNRMDGHNLYGYARNTLSYARVNYLTNFPLLNGIMGSGQIIDGVRFDELNQRFTSFFGNATYTFLDRYFLSGSIRRDASNLFGVSTNNRWQPLWSAGLAWDITKESFYHFDALSRLKIRGTYGYNGNANNSYSANPIMEYSGTHSITSYTYAYMVNPSNPDYRSEKVGVFNLGLDFAALGNRISGTVDFYKKDGRDIVARGMVDPTTGFDSQILNVAHFAGRGIEANLQTLNIKGNKFSWISNLIFNYQRNITKKYNYRPARADSYLDAATSPNPVEGRDLYGLYAYPFAGLDPQTGEPLGWMNGEKSKEYTKFASSPLETLKFMGSTIPLYSGFVRNTFNYGPWSLSTNIQYKFKFVFRRPTINYSALANYWTMHEDFDNRWRQPGDELNTNVPAFIYPLNNARDNFYTFSDAVVERGDAIRIKDINVNYNFNGLGKGKIRGQVFFNMDNMNLIIWKKTGYNVDSDYYRSIPIPRTYTLGATLNL
ncbi:SusC/RagA family TonB-linked outer membrane protein [Sphingobacterium thalpophilum]|uniref:SusC/RagA family TonB-linked outer membrane protein n=1 Tax=Sphingobacterium thalpophilum TaxID=259 RepID=A0ACD5C531_9SPHI